MPPEDDRGCSLDISHRVFEIEASKRNRASVSEARTFVQDMIRRPYNSSEEDDSDVSVGSSSAKKNSGEPVTWQFDNRVVPIHPDSHICMIWKTIIVISIAFTVITDPISIAFHAYSETEWFNICDRMVMVLYMLDIVFHFITGYRDKEGRLVMRYSKVAKHYCGSWFTIDFVAALPCEVFMGVRQIGILKAARVTTVGLHVVKYSRILSFINRLQLHLDVQFSPFIWRFLTGILVFITWLHCVACTICLVWLLSDDEEYLNLDVNSVGKFHVFNSGCGHDSRCIARLYLRSFRTAVAFMIGHGQFSGTTYREELLTTFCALFGKVMYSGFVSLCVQTVLSMYSYRTGHYQASKKLDHYLGKKKVPFEMKQRVRKFLEASWDRIGGTNEALVFEPLPKSLRSSLHYGKIERHFCTLPFFQDAPRSFLVNLAQFARVEAFVVGDCIIQSGELAQNMYILEDGIVQVCMDDRVVAELGPGSYFGENALTHYRVVRNTSMRAKTEGTVTMIPNKDARRLLRRFPAIRRKVEQHVKEKFSATLSEIEDQQSDKIDELD